MLPKNLQKGDTIAILAPAKRIEREFVDFAVKVIEEQGFKAIISSHCLDENNYFSGTIEERKKDFQWALDNENVTAILCARGDRKSTRLNSSHVRISYAVFCLKKK